MSKKEVTLKIVPVNFYGEEVKTFEEQFKRSTAKTQGEFLKTIILNYFKNTLQS